MSTRHVVEHVLKDYGYSPDVVPQIVNNLLDEHAHDLAEEIRAADFGDPYYTGTGQAQAADLIDPEVT
ncbi:hypothetical protein ACFRNT_11455 [Streptomyces sp. NPDC056697]|uniref:hypothetical protein n=1 Tax=Streptomyces sp. NPDC056697 TaxID=3345915 RepID=UPI0036C88A8D